MATLAGYHVKTSSGLDSGATKSAAFTKYDQALWPPLVFKGETNIPATEVARPSISAGYHRVQGPIKTSRPYFGAAYSDDYYHRIRIIPNIIDLGTFTDSETSFIVWNAYFDSRAFTAINTTAVAADNLILTGDTSGTMPGISTLNYTLAAGPDGSPAIDVTYTWDFSSGVDPVLTVQGQRVITLPWIALTPMSKTISWLTGAIKTYASEQRRGLRRAPRQAINYDIFVPRQDRLNLETRFESLSALYAVPLWFDVEDVGALVSGANTINLTTDNSFYQPGGLIFLYESTGLSEAKTIDTVGSGQVTLTSGIANNYTNARAVAAVAGHVSADPTINRDGAENNFASLSFNIIDYYTLPADSYTQYKSLDVLLDPSVVAQSVPMQVTQSRTVRDNNIGPISVGANENRVRIQDTQRWIKSTRAGRYQLEQWFQSRYGQRIAFYQPTWAKDFVVTTAIGAADAFIDVETTRKDAPFDIMVELTDGTRFFREVLTKAVQGSGHRLNLDSALGQSIAIDDIERVSLLRLTRHATDSVTIQYSAPNITRAEILTTTH